MGNILLGILFFMISSSVGFAGSIGVVQCRTIKSNALRWLINISIFAICLLTASAIPIFTNVSIVGVILGLLCGLFCMSIMSS